MKSSGATSVWQMDKCGRSGTYDNKDCAGEPLRLTGTDYASGPCIVPDAYQHINARDYATLYMCSNATAFSSWIDSNPADPVSICKQAPPPAGPPPPPSNLRTAMFCKDNKLFMQAGCTGGCSNSRYCVARPGDASFPAGVSCATTTPLPDDWCIPQSSALSALPAFMLSSGSATGALSFRIGCPAPNGEPSYQYYASSDCSGNAMGVWETAGGCRAESDPSDVCKVESAWSAWSTCTCDDTANIIRTRTRMDGSVESESRMCQLVDPCPGVADAEPAKVQMELVSCS